MASKNQWLTKVVLTHKETQRNKNMIHMITYLTAIEQFACLTDIQT